MNVADEVRCCKCGYVNTVDIFDLEEGGVFCIKCGEETEIEENELEKTL